MTIDKVEGLFDFNSISENAEELFVRGCRDGVGTKSFPSIQNVPRADDVDQGRVFDLREEAEWSVIMIQGPLGMDRAELVR